MSWSFGQKMDINFRLNNKTDSHQLSDRIINSADEVFKAFLSDDSVQKFLMKGEMTDHNVAIAHRRMKDAENMDDLEQYISYMMRKTDDAEEKQFFELSLQGYGPKIGEYKKKFQQLFGKIDPKLVSAPATQWVYSYKNFALCKIPNGPVLNGMVILLAMFMVGERVLDYLKQNPNYSENSFAKMLLFEELNCKPFYERFRQLIDRKANQVSEEDVEQLSELFRRAVAYERLILKHNCSGGQWFEG